MKRIIIVPDVHGRTFWRSVLDNKEDTIVFLGDYTDPYEDEGFTYEDSVCELEDIIQFKKDNPERVKLLLGNHDIHYLFPSWACQRYHQGFYERYKNLFINNEVFKIAHQEDKYLFTHAGVTKDWIERNNLNTDPVNPAQDLTTIFEQIPQVYNQYGRMRGWGGAKTGSPIWCDLREHDNEGAYLGMIQIFGHTQLINNYYQMGNMWCLDCRKVFVLENNELKEYGK